MPTNDFFNHDTDNLPVRSKVRSTTLNSIFSAITSAFGLLPALAVLIRGLTYTATTAGVANTYTATISDKVTAYQDGMRVQLKIHAAGTGASTVNVNAIGVRSIKRSDGSDTKDGDLPLNSIISLVFNSTNNAFLMASPSSGTITDLTAAAFAAAVAACNVIKEQTQAILDAAGALYVTMQATAAAAAASAASALAAPGTSATSTTSLAIGLGAKALTIQTGKLYSVGQAILIARTADPTDFMWGSVTSYDSATGALVVNATTSDGSGTFAAWTVSLSANPLNAIQPIAQATGFTISGGTLSKTLNIDEDLTATTLLADIAAAGISAASSVTTTTTTTTTKTHYDFNPTDFGTYLKLIAGSSFTSTGTKYTAKNKSCFDVAIRDNSNVLLGFIPPGGTVTITLLSTTGDGTWSLDGASDFGATCSVANTSVLGAVVAAVELNNQYVFFLNASGSAVVVDRLNNSVGAAVAVTTRTTDMRIIKHSETEVLIVSGSAGNASIGARLISISGTTITANAETSQSTYGPFGFWRFKYSGVASVTTQRYHSDDALISVSELQANTYFTHYQVDNGSGGYVYSCNAIVVTGTAVAISPSKNDGGYYAQKDGGAAVLSGNIVALRPDENAFNTKAVRYSVSGAVLTELGVNSTGSTQSIMGAKVVGDLLVWLPQGAATVRAVRLNAGSLTFSEIALPAASVGDMIYANGAIHYAVQGQGIYTVYDNGGTLAVASTAMTGASFFLTEPDENNKGYIAMNLDNVNGYQVVYQVTFNSNAAITINSVQSQPHDSNTASPSLQYYALGKSRIYSTGNFEFMPQRGALRGTRSAKDLRNYRHWVDRFFDFDQGRLRLKSDKSVHNDIMTMTNQSGGANYITGIGVGPTHQCTVATGGTINGSARSLLLEIV